MSAPDFIPTSPTARVRAYSSPPRRNDSWSPDRVAEVKSQPAGDGLGSSGPDQGYCFTLVKLFDDQLFLGAVNHDDVAAGCVALAMKRASLYGRAPVVHDLTVAFAAYGFLNPSPDNDLVTLREDLFAECRSPHHYFERRHIVDIVKVEYLKQPHAAAVEACSVNWKEPFRTDKI